MANYGLFFAETDDSADRNDDEVDILNESLGWRLHVSGSMEEILDWFVDTFNDDDLPSPSNNWCRVVKYKDDTIVDGDLVVL